MRFIPLLTGLFFLFPGILHALDPTGADMTGHGQNSLGLTPEESAWLRDHPVVKLGMDPQWPPFSFTNETGAIEGIDRDFLSKIGGLLGLEFAIDPSRAWGELNEHLQKGQLDLVSGIHPTAERERLLLFTRPYASFPTAIITRLDGPFLTDLGHMENLHMASPRGYVTTERLRKDYPNLYMTETDTVLQALQLVSRGKADFAMENLASVSYLIRSNGLANLKIAGIGDTTFQLHFGVRRDLPLLHSSVEKVLASITSQERAKILSSWVYIEREPPNALRRHLKAIITGLVLTALLLAGLWLRNRKLGKELAERRRIEAELRRLNEEKSQFMSMAAHDISNPLAVIKIDCQLAISRQEKVPGAEPSGYEHILKHAQRISHLISSLLDQETVDTGQNRLYPKLIDLAETVNKVVESYSHISARKNITFTHVFPQKEREKAYAWADPDSVMQVMENLISNAVKFSPPSGTVTVTTRVIAGLARVEVSDTGPGITEEDRPHLFGWFSRLSARPTADESSHGLGLFIVKELMDDMNGRVWVDSTPGQGATFIIEFAARPDSAARG